MPEGLRVAMNKKTNSGAAPIQPWRKRCQRFPNLFSSLTGTAAEQRRAERVEAEAVSVLVCDFQPLAERAAALRRIVELRECTVRQVAMFFEVEAEVVVAALSLLPATAATAIEARAPSAVLVSAA